MIGAGARRVGGAIATQQEGLGILPIQQSSVYVERASDWDLRARAHQ